MVLDPPWENASAARGAKYAALPSRALLRLPLPALLNPVSDICHDLVVPTIGLLGKYESGQSAECSGTQLHHSISFHASLNLIFTLLIHQQEPCKSPCIRSTTAATPVCGLWILDRPP